MKRAGYLMALCLTFFLAGCRCWVNDAGIVSGHGYEQGKKVACDTPVWDMQADSQMTTGRKDAASNEGIWEPAQTGYAFGTLSREEERQLYFEILDSLKHAEDKTRLTVLDDDCLEAVFDCVLADHPEIFYVDGYSIQIYKLQDQIKEIAFAGTYTVDKEQIEALSISVDDVMDRWMAGMDPEWDDYEKTRYLYEKVIVNTEYDTEAADGQNVLSVFLNGRSVCQGYAKAFQLLCMRAGLESVLASGSVNGTGHAWTMVALDNAWYHVDPTWGDAAWILDEPGALAKTSMPDINYDYFCVTTQEICQTHQPKERFEWPECTAVENQYYRQEGLYLESADTELIGRMLMKAIDAGKESITIQCSDEAVYRQVYEYLIGEQKILDILSVDRISYAESDRHRTITFWF